jgi:REP element-mobilizing transposase RayT
MHAVDELALYRSTMDASMFLKRLGAVAVRRGVEIHCYCLMASHYHLLVRDQVGDVSAAMADLNGWYAMTYNRRYGRRGPVFDARFHRTVIEDDDQLRTCIRYIVRNPVEAGLCTDPVEWRWSSHRATIGLARPPAFLRTDVALGPSGSVASYLSLVDVEAPDR